MKLLEPEGSPAHGGSARHADQWINEALELKAEESLAIDRLIFGIDRRAGNLTSQKHKDR